MIVEIPWYEKNKEDVVNSGIQKKHAIESKNKKLLWVKKCKCKKPEFKPGR